MKPIKVEVTAEDIETGKRNDPCHCPVALAIMRTVPGVSPDGGLFAGVFVLRWADKCMRTPDAVAEFIVQFDGGGDVHPFAFELEPSNG